MSEVSRSLVYARDEKGPEWFDDFLRSLANLKESSTQDILNSIYNVKNQTVAGVVQNYREQVGLDIIQSEEDHDEEVTKQASLQKNKLSVRHGITETNAEHTRRKLSFRQPDGQSIVEKIKSSPDILASLESICRHTGGTVKIPSLINFLRKKIDNSVGFNDQELKDFLNELKKMFLDTQLNTQTQDYVGMVGVSNENYDDDLAEYMRNDR